MGAVANVDAPECAVLVLRWRLRDEGQILTHRQNTILFQVTNMPKLLDYGQKSKKFYVIATVANSSLFLKLFTNLGSYHG
jgi:hypothetical protein